MYRCFFDKTNVRVITPIHEIYRLDLPLFVQLDVQTMNVFDEVSQNNITAS